MGSSRFLDPEILGLVPQLTVGRTLHAHIVARGTYLPDTIRCAAHGESRLPPQRDSSTGAPTIKCYADVRVHEVLFVGSGPSALTVIAFVFYYLNFYEIGDYAILPPDKKNETEQEYIERIRVFHEQRLDGGEDNIEGREAMLFLGPSLDINIEAWEVMRQWRLEQRNDGTVVAVHPLRDDWRVVRDDFQQYRSQLEMELPAFRQAAAAAHEARVAANGGRTRPEAGYPMLVSDANQLSSYYREVGAYDDPDNSPAQPPPPYAPFEYLTAEIPPCTPAPGASVDPCDPDAPPLGGDVRHRYPELSDEPLSLREMLDGFTSPPAWVSHLAVRGTYLPGTVRCTADDPFRPPSYLSNEFSYEVNPQLHQVLHGRARQRLISSAPALPL